MGDPLEAALFHVLLPALGVTRVIEIGVFTGYTTLQLARAVGPTGKVVALDVNEEFVSVGRPYWEKAGVADRIDLRIGSAVESLKNIIAEEQENQSLGSFDFCFVDADKTNYKEYYELCIRLIRPNGIIAIDNTLWGGRVLDDKCQDESTVAVREINKFIFNDNRVDHVLLPLADGVTLVRKK